MRSRNGVAGVVLTGACCAMAFGGPDVPPDTVNHVGPDVIVGELHQVALLGSNATERGYGVGTTSCNIGDTQLLWYDGAGSVGTVLTPATLRGGNVTWTIDGTNYHPVIAQNMYRLKDGRLEQIGYSWLKHGFTALQGSVCVTEFGPCTSSGTGDRLGVGCSDPYGASLNGSYSYLGPRYQVNPSTGEYPHPFASYPNGTQTVEKRVRVQIADIDPTLNPGALYFVEGHYIGRDDAYWDNDDNNASYRRITLSATGSPTFPAGATTQRRKAGIHAWHDHGNGVNTPNPNVKIAEVHVPNDGLFLVGCNVFDNGDGTWRYEYAIQNLNSDRAAGNFSVPVPQGVAVTNIGFKDVDRHSGEQSIYDNTDWRGFRQADAVAWFSPEPYSQNPSSNALRWGIMYNFWFTADAPPTSDAEATLGMFRPSATYPNSMLVTVDAPASNCICETDGDAAQVDVFDLLAYLNGWFAHDAGADIDGTPGVDVFDLLFYLDCWFDASASGAC